MSRRAPRRRSRRDDSSVGEKEIAKRSGVRKRVFENALLRPRRHIRRDRNMRPSPRKGRGSIVSVSGDFTAASSDIHRRQAYRLWIGSARWPYMERAGNEIIGD